MGAVASAAGGNMHELDSFAREWPDAIAGIVEGAIADGEIEVADLRTIVVAPIHGFGALGVWLGSEWQDFPYVGDVDGVAGLVSIAGWLDEVDAITRGELDAVLPARGFVPRAQVRFADPRRQAAWESARARLHANLVAACQLAATTRLAGKPWKRPVGIFAGRGDGAEAMLQAFCHPEGAPLWPLQEHREEHGYGSAYPHASLHADRLVVFYPEGEGDSLGKKGRGSVQTYRFADIASARVDDDDVYVKVRGEVFEVRFGSGHTHEETGGPDRDAVRAALTACFAPILREPSHDLPASQAAFQAWIDERPKDHDKRNAVEALCKRHDVEAVAALVDGATLDAGVRAKILPELARAHLAAGRAGEALARLDAAVALDKNADRAWLRAEALWQLGRHAEAAAVPKAPPWVRIVALAAQGNADDAIAIAADPKLRGDEDAQAALAIVLAGQGKLAEAERALREAFLEGRTDDALVARAAETPVLAAVIDAQRAWLDRRAASAAQLDAIAAMPAGEPPVWARDMPASAVLGTPLAPDKDDRRQDKLPVLSCALRVGDTVWAGDRKGDIVAVTPEGRRPIAHPFSGEHSIERLVLGAGGVLASDGTRLALLDDSGEVRARAQPLVRGDGPLAAAGDLIALGNGAALDLYRHAGGALVLAGTLAMPRERHVRGVAFVTPSLLAAAIDGELLCIDARDPAAPVVHARLAIPEVNAVAAAAGTVVAYGGNVAWLVDCHDPAAPRVLGRFRLEIAPLVAPDGQHVWLIDRGRAWSIDVAAGCVADHRVFFGPDGSYFEPLALWREGDGLVAVAPEGMWRLSPVPYASAEQIRGEVEADRARVAAFFRERVTAWLAGDEPVGAIRTMWFAGSAQIAALAPASVAALVGADPIADGELELTGSEPDRGDGDKLSRAERQSRQRVSHEEEQTRAHVLQQALRRCTSELAVIVGPAVQAARHVALVAYDPHDVWEIVDVVATRGEAEPERMTIEPRRARTTLERLSSSTWYREVDVMIARARRDPTFRAEVLDVLAKRGLNAAARIARALAKVDPEAVLRAWIAAAAHAPGYAVHGLADFPDRPEARSKLGELADSADHEAALVARDALGRLDEPATLDHVRAVLADNSIDFDDLAGFLAQMSDATLEQLRDDLAAAHARIAKMGNEYMADLLLVPLVRAGASELPDKVLKRAHDEQKSEGDLDGIFLSDDPRPASTAVRHLVARAIEARLAAGDGQPLWPEKLASEHSNGSWQRFLDLAWPRWERAGLIAALHARLAERVTGGAASEIERELARHVLLRDLLRADPAAEAFGAALARGSYEPRVLDQVKELARLSRVQVGWNLVKEKKYAEARRLADAALADAPANGQVLFFDARVAWLETNDPAAAIARIPAALDKATDGIGRGRLYNLYGAALDAQGKIAESIAWFEKALGADPTQAAMLLSNIAEAHWKLGHREDAAKFASQAARRGSDTAIVKEILAATEAAETDDE